MKICNSLSAGLLLALAAATAGAQTATLLPADTGDLRPAGLATADRAVAAESLNTSTETVSMARSLDGDTVAAGSAAPRPFMAESRQYWVDATTTGLANGVDLPLSAPGALIRISPLEADGKVRLDPRQLELTLDGRPLQLKRDLELVTTGKQLRAASFQATPGSIAFRLRDAAGAGVLTLRSRRAGADIDSRSETPLVIHVYEPDSPVVARISLPRQDYLAGEAVRFDYELASGGDTLAVDSLQAVITDPSAGQSRTLTRSADGTALTGTLPDDTAGHPAGLWEAHVYLEGTVNGLRVRRDVPAAFGVTLPTARLDGRASAATGDGLRIGLGMEVAQAGRYQVSGTVFGTAAGGELVAVARAESAGWLNAGSGELALEIDAGKLAGYSAPWEVRGLRLADQGRLGLLEYRQRAVTVSAD